ncbi:MAG: pilus assembly PilX N-terminal domain-containing protein [Verrucomicrobiota bacterium]
MNTPHKDPLPKGFALVITLSLMVLLTLIVVGLLSLSGISLRSAAQDKAMASARSNARLALILAIGDLQKSLGPDRAVSAPSEILAATPAKAHTTGVWESWWDFNPGGSSLNYGGEKTKRFRRWLVSNTDHAAVESRDFAASEWSGKTIELVGNNALGGKVTASAKVVAGLVPVVRNGKAEGAYAWHVADESQKARINLYRDPAQNTTVAQQRALLAGQRPDPSVMKGGDGNLLSCLPTDQDAAAFKAATTTSGKLTDLAQVELYGEAMGKIKPLRHDLTPYSLGVLADVRSGGLKQDLSSVFEMSSASATKLPSDFPSDFTGGTRARLYASTPATPGGTAPVIANGISDPNWSTLSSYYNSFRSITTPDTTPTYAVTSGAANTDPVPTAYNPAPVIAKVDTIFSLVARPLTDIFWLGGVRDFFDYHVNLIFTPVVTLHNPYNVNISFHKMEVSFQNIPVAFNFMFQADGSGGFVSQCVVPGSFEAINTMSYSGADHNGRKDKIFVMNIANWNDADPIATSSSISGPIVMKPGQTLVCGPIFPPDSSFQKDAGLGHNTVGFDWDNKLTKTIKAKPSFTPGLGYEMYAVTIAHIRQPGGNYPGGMTLHPFMMMRDLGASPKISKTTTTDRFYMEFKIQRPSWYIDDASVTPIEALPSFAVNAKLQATASGTPSDYAKLDFEYQSDTSLKSFFNNRVYRYPPTGSLTGSDCAAPGGVTYSTQGAYVHPFAIFSAYARTTNGGVYETGKRSKGPTDSPQINLLRDGRLAGKPFLFHNPSRANFTMNLATEKPGVQAYELNFQPFLSKGDFQDYMDVDGNRVPALTGNTTGRGIKSGSYLEVPTGPMQTIADFRRSNALTTSYLPGTVQPVGNSLVSPLMSTDKVRQTDKDVATNELLDHSLLANHALYDRFYFSTIATRGSETPDAVFEKFMNGTTPLASQAFQPYPPGGKSVAAAKADLFSSGMPKDDAYKTAAEYQMIQGPFNVNSTSVQAWKAVLASMNKSDIVTLWAKTNKIELKKAAGVPILGMSLINGGVTGGTADFTHIDDAKSNDWNGHRELTDTELEALATRIVDQVRTRGPFLTMSEFVNRQVGTNGPLTQRGALEAAIENSAINKNFFLNNETDIELSDISDTNTYKYNSPNVVTGNPAAGAPGWISQGDLLRILEPAATVRGDTFVIRVCGEAWDSNGKETARAYAEAVVQRVPEYVDPVDRPSLNAYTSTTTTAAKANKTFGRRFNVVSFRWLSTHEI